MRRPTGENNHKPLPVLALLASLALVTACSTAPFSAPAGRVAQIERTAHGIPHITAPDWYGIGYGVAYAHAQDNACQTAQHMVTMRGERSQFFGPQAMGQLGVRTLPNAQIDAFIRSHMDDALLATAARSKSAEARAATSGYVAGFNRYLGDTGVANLPAECKGQAWVRPMTETDLARATEVSMVQAGVAAFADGVLGAVPPKVGARGTQDVGTEDDRLAALREYMVATRGDGELGSNGWAFGRNATPDGAGVLLGNPHFPWVGSNRFWQMHITIPGQVDAMGAGIGNSPVVQIGFNHDVAWTHTVSTGARFTLYELALDPADPTTYIIDGQKRKMVAQEVRVPAGGAAGASSTHTVWRTQWGPVVVVPRAGLGWTTSSAYAIADANTLNTRTVDTWMRMNRARSVQELRDAMGQQAIPWVNTIAADRAGNALYADLSVVPDVSAAMLQRCAPSARAAGLLAGAGIPVLNGSRADCAWNRDAAAAIPGLTPASRMPVVITPDWVQNSNDSYWLANPDIKPSADFSPLVGPVNRAQRLRTRSAILEIRARLAGSDQMAGNRMGVDEVRSVIFRNRNLAAVLVLSDLLAACADTTATVTPAQREGCTALAGWDRTNNVASKGAPLFREFWRKAKDIPKIWREPFDPANPVMTPAGLDMATAATRGAVFKALEDAVGIVKAAGFPADVALGQAQFREVRGQRVPIPGGDEFEGVLNKTEAQGQPQLAAGGYRINFGSSYVQAVTFDAQGPVAYGLLTYGQGSSAESPHAYDQLALFSRKEWVRVPFARAEVERQRVGAPLMLAY
jgi:acyl-homoserine-lactone acylase